MDKPILIEEPDAQEIYYDICCGIDVHQKTLSERSNKLTSNKYTLFQIVESNFIRLSFMCLFYMFCAAYAAAR